jgi:hypothetical protein
MKLKKLLALIIACVFMLSFAAGCVTEAEDTLAADTTPQDGGSETNAADTDDDKNDDDDTTPSPTDNDDDVDVPAAPEVGVKVPMTLPATGAYLEDPFNSNIFSAADGDGFLNYNFKDSGGAWVNIMNPWGASAFLVFEPGANFVQSMIITFEVEDYDGGDEGFRAMCGFGINGFTPSVWALGDEREDTTGWEEIFGEEYFYYIDGDGVYQMIVSFRAAMDWQGAQNEDLHKDFVEGIDVIELGIFGPSESTSMKVTILGIEETADVFLFEDIGRPLGSDAFFAASVAELPPLPAPGPPHEPRTDD